MWSHSGANLIYIYIYRLISWQVQNYKYRSLVSSMEYGVWSMEYGVQALSTMFQ